MADGECLLCRRTVGVLHCLDWCHRLTLADASNDEERARLAPGLDRDLALTEMHVIDQSGNRTAGYDGYLRLSAAIPLLWLPGLIGRIPAVAQVGRRVYRRVAASRTRIGRCTDRVCAPGSVSDPPARR